MAPRVLAVFVDRPWPGLTGDMQRVRALVAAVERRAESRVVLAPRAGSPAGRPPKRLRVSEVERSGAPAGAVARFVGGLPAMRPPMMAFYRQGPVRRHLERAIEEHEPDLVLTHHLGGAAIVDGLVPRDRVVLDLPNDEVQRFGRLAATSGGVAGRVRWSAERELAQRWFRRSLGGYRAVTVVSEEDAEAYRRLVPEARIVVVPNGTDPPPSVRPDPGGREVLFLGDLEYAPNRDGIEWFVAHVLPGADVEAVRVVGRGSVTAAPKVVALGFVDDLAAELRRATAMVVPLRAGGGTRLKVLEAFGWGIPVVSTLLGVEGLAAEPEVHYLAAETPTEWHAQLDRVLGDEALRARLAAAGRALVDDRFTWTVATAPLEELLDGSAS